MVRTVPRTPYAMNILGRLSPVGGLLTGQDLLTQLRGNMQSDLLLLPHNMLRECEDVFLDGMTVEELSQALGVRIVPVRGGGDTWIQTIYDLAAE